eukprot:c21200_g1_i1.p1 GENE.c21200_g1_i1~~c21200_g1_i1.p1  ORF type:complete len:260 (+),score=35.12 c21200_g1_i1:40-819(+)
MRLCWLVVLACSLATGVPLEGDPEHTYSYTLPSVETEPISFDPGLLEKRLVCPDENAQPPNGLFRRYVCHISPDHNGRRRRRPSPNCAFAMVGVRGVEALRNAIDMAEQELGLEVDDFDFARYGHNLMHQGFIYGDEDGRYDFTSSYYCGQQADAIGYRYYGWVCQDPDSLVNAYRPITNDTIALDNWFPFQYDLVGRKFNCERLWESEMLVAPGYDSCTHPDTAGSYRTIWRNCHTYVNTVVAKYDELEALAKSLENK